MKSLESSIIKRSKTNDSKPSASKEQTLAQVMEEDLEHLSSEEEDKIIKNKCSPKAIEVTRLSSKNEPDLF